jgi:alkanesulfonate monooxygenase SsuD/methylene tetrahydromethanopterin reductase-like flavin-dependent oxidoreductase (luciferase family)
VNEVHPFRFGIVAAPREDGERWLDIARRTAELGFGTLLVPDGLAVPAPLPALALAATVPGLRVGTFVLAAPLRPPRLAAWEAHSLTALTGGRFEFGIGTGRPAAARHVLGVDPAELRDRDTLAALRGSPTEMADELRRRRDTLGFSYIVVSDAFLDVLAPVVERLVGT